MQTLQSFLNNHFLVLNNAALFQNDGNLPLTEASVGCQQHSGEAPSSGQITGYTGCGGLPTTSENKTG